MLHQKSYNIDKQVLESKSYNYFDGFKAHFSETPLTDKQLWRLCDLMKQFYALRESAEVFQYGGHYTNDDRNPLEINKEMADKINEHIKNVIIPEVRKLMDEVKQNKF